MPNNTSKYQPRKTSSRATYILGGVAILVIAVLVIGGLVWNSQRDKDGPDESVLNSNAALIVGAASAPQTIDVFEDFMCPYCKEFEQQSGAAIAKAVDDGKLRVRYHMLTFLNKVSASGDYSSRSAGAAQCVGEGESKDVFLKFHSALFAKQPAENGDTDLSNADLAKIAAEQGASPETQKCVSDGSMVEQANVAAAQSLNQLSKALGGQAATPTVLSAGEPVPDIMNGTAWLDKLLSDKS
ncbi:thioredoxin domain-containing protein [Gordonia sp. CPCC 205515]|uniref:DsbA family protein n=1 Tax=Gordonia sp. CPCC 205515 TaxID=3140791 RepID=UPI003AF3AD93